MMALILNTTIYDGTHGVELWVDTDPSLHFLLLFSIFIQIVLLHIISIIIWYGIIVDQQQQTKSNKSSLSAMLLGLVVIIPLSFVLPVTVLNALDVRNTALRFGCILLPIMVPLKCSEALFGQTNNKKPLPWTQSLVAYRYYAGFPQLPIRPVCDGNEERGSCVLPVQVADFVLALRQAAFWFVIMTLLYNLLEPFDFRPFSQPYYQNYYDSFLPTFHLGRIYNSFAQVCLFFATLIFAMKTTGVLCMLIGQHKVDHFLFDRQPLFCSTSPRDFWSNRWNTLIHHHLKVGIYKPIVMRGNGGGGVVLIGTVATFLVSAVLHEYVSYLQFFRTDAQLAEVFRTNDATAYDHQHEVVWGKHLVFFGWNAMLIVLQDITVAQLRQTGGWQVLTKESWSWLPWWLKSHLVVLLSLPVAHCYMDDVVERGYLRDLRPLIPLLRAFRSSSSVVSAN